MRAFWFILGALSFIAGFIGVFLPLLPTVPLMILAAYCFARSSRHLHDWLLAHPTFGPAIADWRRSGAISRRGKQAATIGIFAALGLSFAFGVPKNIVIIQMLVMCGVAAFIWTRPEA